MKKVKVVPMKIRVGYMDYPVTFQPEDCDSFGEYLGEFDKRTGIKLWRDQLPSEMASTLIHEIIHAIYHVHELPKMLTEEQACCRLEAPLFMFIRDNPELVKQLQDAAGGKPLPGIVEVHDD